MAGLNAPSTSGADGQWTLVSRGGHRLPLPVGPKRRTLVLGSDHNRVDVPVQVFSPLIQFAMSAHHLI
jgi:hypothetical protein